MKSPVRSFPRFSLAILVAFTLSLAVSARAQTETTLHSFANDANGYNPVASLALDPSGNLFGTTSEGGNFTGCSTGCGVVFELSPASGGASWSETVPYTFAGGKDGANPFVAVTPDGLGNYYGATGNGGNISKNPLGLGTIFKLSPNGSGGWTKTTIHVFDGGPGGSDPYGNLIFDSAGNLYGTAHNGGETVCDCGIVFELSPTSGGGWKETVLHAFNAKNGSFPNAGVIDLAGNLFGTTTFGGPSCTASTCGSGLVFELSPVAGGGWKENVLYAFENGSDGGYPVGGVIFDAAGNLYGTTQQAGTTGGACGPSGCGVVFELSLKSGGGWKETVLHSFSGADGNTPRSGLVLAASDFLYGTTYFGGTSENCGIVYQLSPASGGGWTEATTYNFTCGDDGANPEADLITDSVGNLYSTTQYGGANGYGTVYEITP